MRISTASILTAALAASANGTDPGRDDSGNSLGSQRSSLEPNSHHIMHSVGPEPSATVSAPIATTSVASSKAAEESLLSQKPEASDIVEGADVGEEQEIEGRNHHDRGPCAWNGGPAPHSNLENGTLCEDGSIKLDPKDGGGREYPNGTREYSNGTEKAANGTVIREGGADDSGPGKKRMIAMGVFGAAAAVAGLM